MRKAILILKAFVRMLRGRMWPQIEYENLEKYGFR